MSSTSFSKLKQRLLANEHAVAESSLGSSSGSGGGVRAGAGGKALSLEAAGKRAMRGGDDDEAVTAAADAQVLNGALISRAL